MRRLLMSTVLAASVALAAVAPAAADPVTEISIHESFVDVDPCTGNEHEVTIDWTFFVHEHDGRTVARGVRTLSTSSGYSGRGTTSFVLNDNVEMFRGTDMLTDGSGNRIRASAVFLFDRSSDAVRIDRFELTCVGA
jgi:hypothetical protein